MPLFSQWPYKSNEITFVSPWEIRNALFRRLSTLIKRKCINYAPRALYAARLSEKSPNQKVASTRFVRSWIFHVHAGPRSSIRMSATFFHLLPKDERTRKRKYGASWKARWEEKTRPIEIRFPFQTQLRTFAHRETSRSKIKNVGKPVESFASHKLLI